MKSPVRGVAVARLLLLLLVLPIHLAAQGLAESGTEATAAEEQDGTEGDDAASQKDKEKSFEEVVGELDKIEGLFTFYLDADDNKVLLELAPDQFDRDYLYSSKVDRATGERGLYGTAMLDNFVFQWHRLGKRVQFVRKNTRFRAEPGSPAERAVASSFSDSVLASASRLSKPHPERESVLVDLSALFVGRDLGGLSDHLKRVYDTAYKLSAEDSAIVLVKSFPRNSEVGVATTFTAEEVKEGSVTVPDSRSLSVRFRYSLVELSENGYRPRLADDRVGHFLSMHMDFSGVTSDLPYVRYVARWKLEKKDPGAAVSEPEEPITFWLENTIPLEYRDWIMEGVRLWNPAFERIGFKNALVALQQPDNADWDPADIRYNTLRWFVAYDASFAVGPSHRNPYTGQQIDADIGLSEGIFRVGARQRYELHVHPLQALEALKASANGLSPGVFGGGSDGSYSGYCDYATGLVEQASFAHDVMAVRPDWSEAKEREFLRQYVVQVVAHEVGHTLGLRHNFRGSTAHGLDQLADPEATREVGLSSSVMDYAPPVVARAGEQQGEYFNSSVGSYDRWAVEYAYRPIDGAASPEDELPELRRIAERAGEPFLSYATDEDAGLSARSLDPRTTRFDFGAQPLEWFEREIELVQELWTKMEAKLLVPGESYAVLRRAFGSSFRSHFIGAHVAMKYIGGIYHGRAHSGDPGGAPPFVPIPAVEQRAALAFLAENIWAADVFRVPAELLSKLQFERFVDFEGRNAKAPRLDYPLHETVLGVQGDILGDLYHPLKLSRLQDLELVFAPGEERFTMADLFIGVRRTLWSELDTGSSISSFRRNLQREHLRHLLDLTLTPASGIPGDATALARADLVELEERMDSVLGRGGRRGLDYVSRAHLEEIKARIEEALEADFERKEGSARS